jgi:Zn-dependent protease
MTLSFRIGRIPVRVLPSFLVTTVVINLGLAQAEPLKLVVWAGIVLASVLVHELGHALAALAFGFAPSIDLHGLGGTTSWGPSKEAQTVSAPKRMMISLAGPAMGFAAGIAVAVSASLVGPGPDFAAQSLRALFWLGPPPWEESLTEFVYGRLLFVNIGWGLLNLLPMLPLDGGNVMAQALALARRPERTAYGVSLIVASLAAAAALATGRWWPALLAVSFVASNWRALGHEKARAHDAPLRAALEKAYAALDVKDGERVLAVARPIVVGSKTAPVRAEALQLVAFGCLLEGRVSDADAAIAALPRGFAPHPALLELRASVSGARVT